MNWHVLNSNRIHLKTSTGRYKKSSLQANIGLLHDGCIGDDKDFNTFE